MLQVADIKNKVEWKSRRGMLELDLIFNNILNNNNFDLLQWQLFDKLLDYQDPDLYYFFMGITMPANKELAEFIKFLDVKD